jgi:hypothetical protein
MYENKKKQQISAENLLNTSIRILNSNIDNSKYSRNFSNRNFQKPSSMSNNLNMFQRPITTRSLPIKNQIEEKHMNIHSIRDYNNDNNNDIIELDNKNENDINNELAKINSKKYLNKNIPNDLIDYQSFAKTKKQFLITKINSPIKKTNLDYFIDYSSNPFTTKFEMLSTTNNLGTSKISRSRSISNLSVKSKGVIENNIISPCLVKPYTNEGTDQINNLFFSNLNNFSNKCYQNIHNYEKDCGYLTKSISDENIENSEFTNLSKIDDENISNSVNTVNYILNDSYFNKSFLKVTENLYTGSVKSITNERKMCKLNIEYLIDITNMRPDDLNRQSISKLPCLCSKQHSRIYLSIEITDTSFKSLFNSFSEINKFILRARKSSRRVLIFGKDQFSSIVVCACLQVCIQLN